MADSTSVTVVSVVSLKGGVGKTSVALGLAGAALTRDLRSVVVDLDPQANATTVLDPVDVQFTASDVLGGAHSGKLKEALTKSAWGKQLRLLAGDGRLERHNHPLDGGAGGAGTSGEHRLRTAIRGLSNADLIIIDTPPSLSELTKNALAASDLAVVVTEPTIFSLTGAQQAIDAIDAVRQSFNLRLRPAGIVVNRFRPRSAEHRFRVDELIAAYRELVLDPVLPERSAILRAQGSCVPVQQWPSPGAREIARIFSAYLDQLLIAARSNGNGPFTRGS